MKTFGSAVVILFSLALVNGGIFDLKYLETQARESFLPSLKEFDHLNTTIAETKSQLKGLGPWGIDFLACSNLSLKLDYGERLVIAAGVVFFDADNDLNQILSCPGCKTTLDCVSYVVDRLPDFAEKYKKTVGCLYSDAVLTVEGINFYFRGCIGIGDSDGVPPTPSPADVEKCKGVYA